MAVTICHASISENGNAGWDGKAKAGDQTGKEVCTRTWYAKGWNFCAEYPDPNVAKKAAEIAKKLAKSGLVGYDQSQRNTLYQALKKYNFDVDAYIRSGEKTETDCSAFMYACYASVVPSMRRDGNAPATSNMRSSFKAFGFIIHTESKYLTSDKYLTIGMVLVKEGSHTVMAVTNGTSAFVKTTTTSTTSTTTTSTTSTTSTSSSSTSTTKSLIKKGQEEAMKFTGLKKILGKEFIADGDRGPLTRAMAAAVLQTAMNKDYKSNLVVDGEFGTKSKSALGMHYVEMGEEQYMVTAAEILLYMLGKDPKGVEYPGIFGNGLKNAAGTSKITSSKFLTYLQ